MIGCSCTGFQSCDACGKTAVVALTSETSHSCADWFHAHLCLSCFVQQERALRAVNERVPFPPETSSRYFIMGLMDPPEGAPLKLADILTDAVPDHWFVFHGSVFLGVSQGNSSQKAAANARKQWPALTGKMRLERVA